MLYLIKSSKYLKIGFTNNLEDRLKQYDTHNPDYELISTLNIAKRHEKRIQDLCMPYHYKLEWFYDVPEVIEIFNTYPNRILEELIMFAKEKFEELFKLFANNINYIFNEASRDYLWEIYSKFSCSKIISQFKELKRNIPKNHEYYSEFITNYNYLVNQFNILNLLWYKSYKDKNDEFINWTDLDILPGYIFSLKITQENNYINFNVHIKKYIEHVIYPIVE